MAGRGDALFAPSTTASRFPDSMIDANGLIAVVSAVGSVGSDAITESAVQVAAWINGIAMAIDEMSVASDSFAVASDQAFVLTSSIHVVSAKLKIATD
jgi:hypothetical protein